MGAIHLCRFIRNVCACVVIAGLLTDFKPAVSYGLAVYFMTLFASQMVIEGLFIEASEFTKEGRNGQKPDGEVGGSDVTKAGP